MMTDDQKPLVNMMTDVPARPWTYRIAGLRFASASNDASGWILSSGAMGMVFGNISTHVLYGLPVKVDRSLPDDVVVLVSHDGRELGRIKLD